MRNIFTGQMITEKSFADSTGPAVTPCTRSIFSANGKSATTADRVGGRNVDAQRHFLPQRFSYAI